ncbi:MAG: hypothetical protein M1833_003566 [Piccolia ochrophora]|nr:MAG: hypothetical protein M1833_003566 [Piccolia ochrophora]
MAPQVSLRAPTKSDAPKVAKAPFIPPSLDWLRGTWHVTHSTLPMWKTKRNVSISYTPLSPAFEGTPNALDRLDDLVTYQKLGGDKVHKIHGVDTASREDPGAWDWRGKGLLQVASSHWEVLGFETNRLEDDGSILTDPADWVVTYFASTLFTPAGIDIYFRSTARISAEVVTAVKEALAQMDDPQVTKLANEMFEIKHDELLDGPI